VLRPPGDLGGDAEAFELDLELCDALLEVGLAGLARFGHHLGDLLVLGRLQIEEAEVLELPLDGVHTQTMRERGVYLHGLARLEDAAVLAQRHEGPHVVQAVGELDDDDADVLAHGDEHLAQGVGLRLGEGLYLETGYLGDAIDEQRDLGAEGLLDLFERDGGILDGVVEYGGADGVAVHAQVRQDTRDLERMVDEGLAALATLVAVGLTGEPIGTIDALEVRFVEIGCEGLGEPGEDGIGIRLRGDLRGGYYAVHALPPPRRCDPTDIILPQTRGWTRA